MRILFDVTAHGFGHLAICAAVIKAIWHQFPNIQIMLGYDLKKKADLDHFFDGDEQMLLRHVEGPFDLGIPMHGAFGVDHQRTKQVYDEALGQMASHLDDERRRLTRLKPDLLVSSISPWSLAAGHSLSIPTVAFSSVEWSQQLQTMGLASQASELRSLYAHADFMVGTTPHACPTDITQMKTIPPIGRKSEANHHQIRRQLGVQKPLAVLVTFGGWEGSDPESWKLCKDAPIELFTPRMLRASGVSFLGGLAAMDAVVTKPGYGTYVEALIHGKPIISMPRHDWWEAQCLDAFAQAHQGLIKFEPRFLKEPHALADAISATNPTPIKAEGDNVMANWLHEVIMART